jgi:hypothetical protein
MFKLFKRNKISEPPVKEEMRKWMDNAMQWLDYTFGHEMIMNVKVLVPRQQDFPVQYNGDRQSAIDTLKIIASQMQINANDIVLDIYEERQSEISMGGETGGRFFLNQVEGEKYSGGLYWGRQEDGKYHIGIEQKKLKEPEGMVATLSHELAHIKLLGEKRIEKNNEPLTDLTTIIFGLGVFNANAAFQSKRGVDYWGYSKLGYLSQMEWGYALALFADLRGEENPEWLNFLERNIKADFRQSMRFIHYQKAQQMKNEK